MMRARSIVMICIAAAGMLALGIWLDRRHARAQGPAAPATPEAVERAVWPTRTATPGLPPKPVTPGLAEDLRDPDPLVRRNAVTEVSDPRILVEAARDPDLNVAVAATEGMWTLYREGKLPAEELVARTTDDAPEKVRVAAVNGLGVVTSHKSAAALIDLLANGNDIVRRSAAIVLARQEPQYAVPALIAALRDSDENVRMNARESLRAIARGRDLGEHPDAWSRWWQARAR